MIGLVIGVTLVTMFAVYVETYRVIIMEAQQSQSKVYQRVDQTLTVTMVVFSVLMALGALIAAVGMVNNLSMSVLQPTRELGLLRALGFTAGQVLWLGGSPVPARLDHRVARACVSRDSTWPPGRTGSIGRGAHACGIRRPLAPSNPERAHRGSHRGIVSFGRWSQPSTS
jgi:ABC-type lipoprotein release transport system permease subunit